MLFYYLEKKSIPRKFCKILWVWAVATSGGYRGKSANYYSLQKKGSVKKRSRYAETYLDCLLLLNIGLKYPKSAAKPNFSLNLVNIDQIFQKN